MLTIKNVTSEMLSDINKPNQPFDVIGRLVITFECGKWRSREVLYTKPVLKQYPNYDGADYADYIDADDRIAFLAFDDDECVGQILICRSWNKYAHIEDICVAGKWRGKGIGTALINSAEKWAREKGIAALSLECQDNSILASRFYKKLGFEIGGVNTELYRRLGKPYESETAVFWYKTI